MLKKDINNGFLRVSQLIESEQEALDEIVEFDLQEFTKRAYKDKNHRLQFLTSRILLQDIIENDLGLSYVGLTNDNGVPNDIEGYVVSISHSEGLVAVGVAKEKFGIDIQKRKNKISSVLSRLCSDEELMLGEDSLRKTILWSVKESFYKRNRVLGVDFKKQLFVDRININEMNIIGVGRVFVDKVPEVVKFEGRIIDDYVFIHTL